MKFNTNILLPKFELIDDYFYTILSELEEELKLQFFIDQVRNFSFGDTPIRYDNNRTLSLLTYGVDITDLIDTQTSNLTDHEKKGLTMIIRKTVHKVINEKLSAHNLEGTPLSFKNSIDILFEGTSFCHIQQDKVLLTFKMNSHMK